MTPNYLAITQVEVVTTAVHHIVEFSVSSGYMLALDFLEPWVVAWQP